MKRSNTLRVILELVTILSHIVIGVTIITFLMQEVQPDKSYIGSIILALGVTEIVEYISLKDLAKRRNVLNAVIAGLTTVFGIVVLSLRVDLSIICLIWAIVSICLSVGKIANAGINLLHQPFLLSFIIILAILNIIFSAFLIAGRDPYLPVYLAVFGISILVKAFLLIVEFVIHRYQQ